MVKAKVYGPLSDSRILNVPTPVVCFLLGKFTHAKLETSHKLGKLELPLSTLLFTKHHCVQARPLAWEFFFLSEGNSYPSKIHPGELSEQNGENQFTRHGRERGVETQVEDLITIGDIYGLWVEIPSAKNPPNRHVHLACVFN